MSDARELLRIILPMAKGYAAQHPYGNNHAMVAETEAYLGQADAPAPLPADAPCEHQWDYSAGNGKWDRHCLRCDVVEDCAAPAQDAPQITGAEEASAQDI